MSSKTKTTEQEQETSGARSAFAFLIFFLSGTCGLIYEVVWERMLALVVGGTTYATSIVLATFMAGLALGSYLFGRLSDKTDSPLLVYAFLQIGIGAYGALMPLIMKIVESGYAALSMAVSSAGGLTLVRIALAIAVLLIPTCIMGGTFPLLAKYLARKRSTLGSVVGTLYSVNTWGGVLGSFAGGMYLLARVGMRGTLLLAAGMNGLIGIVTLTIAFCSTNRASSGAAWKRDSAPVQMQGPSSDRLLRALAVGILAVSGFTSLAYEVLWTRMLVFVIGNRTWSFTVILTTFLTGLALGSLIISRFLDRMRRPLTVLPVIQLGIGIMAVLFIPFLGRLNSLEDLFPRFSQNLLLFQFTTCSLVILAPTILMGTVFPFALKLYVREVRKVGSGIGKAYSINTVSSIAGALAGGFILIPLLGLRNGVVTLAWVNAATGAFLVLCERTTRIRRRWTLSASALLSFGALTLALPSAVYMGGTLTASMNRIYYDDGLGGTVEVYETKEEKIKNLTINGVPEVPTDRLSMQTFKMLGHLPLLLQEHPKDVLIVTFGGGIVAGTVAKHDLNAIDCVEICPGVIRAAQLFSVENNNVLENPGVRVHIEDGRHFLLATRKTYDVITADATHPSGADSWVLYTVENYHLLRERLSNNGILVQWLPLHGLTNSQFRIILKTFSTLFPNTTVWLIGANPDFGHALVVGLKSGRTASLHQMSQRLNSPEVRIDLELYGFHNVYSVLSRFLLDSADVALYTEGAEVNTDDLPCIAFTPRRHSEQKLNVVNLASMLPFSSPPPFPEMSSEESDSLEHYLRARRHTIAGMLAICRTDPVAAYEELKTALSINPGDHDAAYLLESYALENGAPAYDRLRMEGARFAGMEMYEEALQRFKRAAQIKGTAEVYSNLGVTFMRLGRYEEARKSLELALQIDSTSEIIKKNLEILEQLERERAGP